jgi:uroporphyrin-III C-methyltransferase
VTVYLVGAGPGAADLLTLRAARLLQHADVVIHDRLIPPDALALAPATALLIDVGKAVGHAPTSQRQINEMLVEHGRRWPTVVRLKGGDPFVFGRGGEEAAALVAAGVHFEVVPGVSAAIAAPAAAGIPVTMRDRSSSFMVVTGHDERNLNGTDWEALGAVETTLVVMMGAGTIGEIAKKLMVGGRDPDTPATAIRWATTSGQEVLRTTLAEIGHVTVEPPTTIVIGDVAALDLRSAPGGPGRPASR